MLALTGQVPSKLIGRGAFQEVDLAAAFGGVAVYTGVALHHSNFAELVNLACKNALLQRGVAHLVFPDDVQVVQTPQASAGTPAGRITDRAIQPPEASVESALERLRAAERPAIVVGHGARFAMDDVMALAERLNCPVLTTFKGKGLVADDHPLGCGVLGRSGTPIASWMMNEADLLVVFGASFSNHTGITSYKPTIQVDYDPMTLGRFHSVTVPVWGEIGVTARRFLNADALGERSQAVDQTGRTSRNAGAIWRAEKDRRLTERSDVGASARRRFLRR